MAVYSIKDIEKLSGIKAHTIRIWEKRYDFITPHRTNTNIRYYTDEELKKILNVAVLKRHGIKISHIAKLSQLELKEEILRVTSSSGSNDTLVDSLVLAMIDLDDYKLEAIIEKSISSGGFQNTVLNVFYPFLEKVGILWQSGDLYPAQEHFVSYLIRQKIISATNALPGTYNPSAKRFLMLLPEGEYHEIGLLFAQYLIREAGHQVLYLGQSVPYSDVLSIGAIKPFEYIVISSSFSFNGSNKGVYLKDLAVAFPDKTILHFSCCRGPRPEDLSPKHIHMAEVDELNNFLESIS